MAIIAARRQNPALRGGPVVLIASGAVAAASKEAHTAGVVDGMSLNQAAQCCPDAIVQPVDEAAVAAVRRLLLSTLYGFTPDVALGDDDCSSFMGLDGLRTAWPERRHLLIAIGQRIESALAVPPVLGIGPTRFVARLAAGRARVGSPVIVEPAATLPYLAPLPIDLLPLDDDMRTYLDLLGLRTLGAVRNVSRVAWRRQFGPKALPVYDLAFGIDPRRVPAWHPPARLEETMPLDPPVDNTEALQFIARALADRLSESLLALGMGTRELLVRLDSDSAAAFRLTVRFAYPLTAAVDVFDGIRWRLLRARVPAPVERITFQVRQLEPAYVRQPGLLLRRDGLRESLADAVARLQEEYRPGLIQRAAIVDGAPPLPSHRIRWSPA